MSPERNIGDPLVTRIVNRARTRGNGRDPELWLAVGGVLSRYVRRYASDLDPQVQSDIVSEKTLDLLVRYDHGQWSPADWSEARVSAYLRSMARFGVADRIRESSRLRPELPESVAAVPGRANPPADAPARAREFAASLTGCLESVSRRDRAIWTLRSLLELSARDTASHPQVRSTPAAVDMALSRCRRRLAACLRRKGVTSDDIPSGAFAALFEVLLPLSPEDSPADEHVQRVRRPGDSARSSKPRESWETS